MQCIHLYTSSNSPTQILRRTIETLSSINFTKDNILSVTRKLSPNKTHGHDQISPHMLQICDKTI